MKPLILTGEIRMHPRGFGFVPTDQFAEDIFIPRPLTGGGLSIEKRCALLGIHRSGIYYKPREQNTEDLLLMAEIDKLYLETPFYGSRRMTAFLQRQGWNVNRKRIRRLMSQMGIEAITLNLT